jgi:O-methyltransferase
MNYEFDKSYASSLHRFRDRIIDELKQIKLTQLKCDIPHELIVPRATYAPWRMDVDFLKLNMAIKDHTLIDIYRQYELYDLSRSLVGLSGDLLEVGVWRGGSAVLLGAPRSDKDDAKLWLADTFSGVPKSTTGKDSLYRGGEHADTSAEDVKRLLLDNRILNYGLLKGCFPNENAELLAAKTFRLVHIDVDTYESAEGVFRWVYPRLCVGGVVVFDDYGFWGCEGVTAFVNELRKEGLFVIHNLNGHALVLKRW